MKHAYTLLGLSFILVFTGAYILYNRAHAPTTEEVTVTPNESTESMSLTLTSSAFKHNERIPSKYTCDGANILPPLSIGSVPEGTQSLVVLMDDPDIPEEVKEAQRIEKFNHFVLYNITPTTTEIAEGEIVGTAGSNSRSYGVYLGPCPPRQWEPTEHRYIFRLYALSGVLSFEGTPTLDEVEEAAQEQMIEKAELVGRYERVQEE